MSVLSHSHAGVHGPPPDGRYRTMLNVGVAWNATKWQEKTLDGSEEDIQRTQLIEVNCTYVRGRRTLITQHNIHTYTLILRVYTEIT